MDIGQSISHFGIMSAQVVFVLLLFALSSVFTQGFDLTAHQGHSIASFLQPTSNSKIQ
jgi:phosphatidylinositol glycan class N